MESCPNCGTKLSTAIFSSNNLLPQIKIDLINDFSETKKENYCNSCGDAVFKKANDSLKNEVQKINKNQQNIINDIPCLSIHSPIGWNYQAISVVTAQTTMGTGFLTELSSDWNDFFGLESRTMNKKVIKGENTCLNILRSKCLNLGGNAIVGIDIDYAEVGGGKGMILVCMTGTAINVKNLDVFSEEIIENLERLKELSNRMKYLSKYSQYFGLLITAS